MNQNHAPVFIVGMPRSGTSLLSEILNVHPNIALVRETAYISFWSQIAHNFELRNQQDFENVWQVFAHSHHVHRMGVDIDAVKEALLRMPTRNLKDIHETLLRAYATQRGATCWGEKNPLYELHLPTIFSWYPDARVIFLIRDPRAVIASLRGAPWSHGSTCLHATEYRRSHEALLRYRNDSRVHAVHYEDLIVNTEAVLRSICEHIGQPFCEHMLNHNEHKNGDYRVGEIKFIRDMQWLMKHIHDVQSPVHSDALEKWRTDLSPRHIATVEHMLAEQMRNLGYERSVKRRWSAIDAIGMWLSKVTTPILYCRPRRWHLFLHRYSFQVWSRIHMLIALHLKIFIRSCRRNYLW